jgi:hypothetical protein
MAGLVPAIHVGRVLAVNNVDPRHKAGRERRRAAQGAQDR